MKWCRAGSNPSRLSRFPAYVNKSRLLTSHSGISSSSMRTKAEPINPAPPVTRNLRIFFYISLTDEYQSAMCYQTIGSVANCAKELNCTGTHKILQDSQDFRFIR